MEIFKVKRTTIYRLCLIDSKKTYDNISHLPSCFYVALNVTIAELQSYINMIKIIKNFEHTFLEAVNLLSL